MASDIDATMEVGEKQKNKKAVSSDELYPRLEKRLFESEVGMIHMVLQRQGQSLCDKTRDSRRAFASFHPFFPHSLPPMHDDGG